MTDDAQSRNEAMAWVEQAKSPSSQNQHDEARALYQKALKAFRDMENRPHEADTLFGVAQAERFLGGPNEARTAYLEARTLYKASGITPFA